MVQKQIETTNFDLILAQQKSVVRRERCFQIYFFGNLFYDRKYQSTASLGNSSNFQVKLY